MKVVILGKGIMLANLILGAKAAGADIVGVFRYEYTKESKLKMLFMDFFRDHYSNPSIEFGYYCVYMAFNKDDINMRCAAHLYNKQQLIILPEDVIQRIESDSTAYKDYELDRHQSLYIHQLPEDKKVSKVIFELKPEDTSKLNILQRLLVYKDDTFVLDDDFHYKGVHINGRHYLIFTRPTTNIFRRIANIKYL